MVETTYQRFAANLTAAMRRKGTSISDISKAIGVSYEMARRYTLGTAKPRAQKMEALAKLLDTPAALLEYAEPDNSNAPTPAQQLAEEREKHGLSQSQLAEKLGISQQAVSKIESGKTSKPTPEVLARLQPVAATNDDRQTDSELELLIEELKLAWLGRSLSTDLLSSMRSMVAAISAQQSGQISGTASQNSKMLTLGQRRQAVDINSGQASIQSDKNGDLDKS